MIYMKKKVLSLLVVIVLVFAMMPSGVVSAATVKKAKITSVKASTSTGKVTVKWKKVKKAKGYQVKIAKKKSGKSVVYKKITKKKKITSKKLANGTYYVRVRAFKKVSGKKKYGKWSKAKKVTVKVTSSTSTTSGVNTSTGQSGDSYDNTDYTYDDSSSETTNVDDLGEKQGTVSFANGTATVSEDASGISASTNDSTGVTTVSITKAGIYTLSGDAANTRVEVKKSIDDTTIILDNLTVDNTGLVAKENADNPFLSIGKDTNVSLVLSGTSTINGSNIYVSEPAAFISQKGDAPTLTISQTDAKDGVLNIVDNVDSDTDFGDVDPADGIATKGELIIKSGSFNVTVNGDCLKGTGSDGTGGVTINGGVFNLKSNQSSAIKSKNGNITINDGKINCTYTGGDAIKTSNYNVEINGAETTIDKCYGDGVSGEWVIINGGNLDIKTYFENAGLNYYNSALVSSSLGAYNKLSVRESGSSKTKTETVNVDTGGHKGIKGGTKAESYKYTTVADGSSNTAGTTYTNTASGGVKITGGKISVDTTNTGIKFNGSGGGFGGGSSGSGNTTTAADGQVIIGSPDDAVVSRNDMVISGGNITVNSSDDGVCAAGNLTITSGAVLKVETAYEGIEAEDITIGTSGSTSTAPYVSTCTNDDGINSAAKDSTSYVYADETEEKYTKTTVSTMSGHDMRVYSGTVVVMIDDASSHSISLPVKNGYGVVSDNSTQTFTYKSNGDGIDCNGSFYAKGGTTIVWGANSNDNSAIDTGDSGAVYEIASGATVIATASSGSMKNNPTTMGQAGVVYSNSVSSGKSFAILDGSNNLKMAAKAPKAFSYLFYCGPGLSSGTSYSLSTGGTLSNRVSDALTYDTRYSSYNTSGASSVSTATASTSISGGSSGPGGNTGGGPGGRW